MTMSEPVKLEQAVGENKGGLFVPVKKEQHVFKVPAPRVSQLGECGSSLLSRLRAGMAPIPV